MVFLFTDTLLIFDNIRHRIKIVSNAFVKEKGVKKAYDEAKRKIDGIINRLKRRGISNSRRAAKGAVKLTSNYTKRDFEGAVEKGKEYIKAGDIFQVVLSQRFKAKVKGRPA